MLFTGTAKRIKMSYCSGSGGRAELQTPLEETAGVQLLLLLLVVMMMLLLVMVLVQRMGIQIQMMHAAGSAHAQCRRHRGR